MSTTEPTTEELLKRARENDARAIDDLLQRHRERLKRMVCIHLDSRLGARVDPSDVVQETLVCAADRLAEYLRGEPLDFYPWLRQIAWNRLIDVHRRHLVAQARTVRREVSLSIAMSDSSKVQLADRLLLHKSSPSRDLIREEMRKRVREAIDRLRPADREILVLIYLEQLRPREIAQIAQVTEKAIHMRHLRALERLRAQLGSSFEP